MLMGEEPQFDVHRMSSLSELRKEGVKTMKKDRICTHCYHIGQPVSQGMGSFFVDGLMWLVFSSLAVLSAFFPLILIPLGWTIYHIAVYRKTTCPECGRLNMVSKTSSKGIKALRGPTVNISYSAADDPNRTDVDADGKPIDRRRSLM